MLVVRESALAIRCPRSRSLVAHPDKAYPDKLEDLNEYMSNNDTKDPWGRPYRMMCGSGMPAGAKGLAVMSAGADGKEGTSDDIKSWE